MLEFSRAFFAVLAACILSAAALVASERELAPIAHRQSDGSPVWISARVAFTATGDLRPELFSSNALTRLDELRAMNGNECLYATQYPSLEIFTPTDSLENLTAHSKTIIAGKVIATEFGFYRGHPGTLFSILMSQRLKDTTSSSRTSVHLFIGTGQLETPRGVICALAPMDSVLPAIGDSVLFFAPGQPIDIENHIFSVEPHRQLVVQSSRALELPKALQNTRAPKDLDAAIERVRAAAGTWTVIVDGFSVWSFNTPGGNENYTLRVDADGTVLQPVN